MTWIARIREEMLSLPLKTTCCRKALLMGLWMGGSQGADGLLHTTYADASVAALCVEQLSRLFRVQAESTVALRVGRTVYDVSCKSTAIATVLQTMDGEEEQPLHQVLGFRCATCRQAFLRGTFLACGTVSHSQKGYHMELVFPKEQRADRLRRFLGDLSATPGKVKRGSRTGLYYKKNEWIVDFMQHTGAHDISFSLMDDWIEKQIRNDENRVTNCLTHNIAKSVDASAKHRHAIEKLYATRRIDALDEELRATATLRLEYPAASLSELARMHRPPISKSGLNRRLARLLAEAEEEKGEES